MKSKDKVLDDIARMAGGAVSLMSGVSKQLKDEIRARVDEMATRLDLVPREDVEHLETLISEMRREQTRLTKRIEALEKKNPVGKTPGKAKSGTAKKAKK